MMLEGDAGQAVQADVNRQARLAVVSSNADAFDVIFEDFGRGDDGEVHEGSTFSGLR